MAHSVAEAAANAVKKSQKTAKTELTNEQKVNEVRKLRVAGLFVTNMEFVDALLEEYDSLVRSVDLLNGAQKTIEAQKGEIESLSAQVEQFRTVYEQENRTERIQVDVLGPAFIPVPTKAEKDSIAAGADQ